VTPSADKVLRRRLTRLRGDHEDHWAYESRATAVNRTTLFQYPAMMVADMQRDLMTALLAQEPAANGPIFDPFIGSGTILGAGMALGRDVEGWDVNPLAILICRVKSGPFHLDAFAAAAERVQPARRYARMPEERFANWRHWFTDDVAFGLTDLRRRIRRERRVATRRFLWLCLAETVRLTSNSRTSTVKLHRRTAEQIANRPDPAVVFARVVDDNLGRLRLAATELAKAGTLSRGGWYRGDVRLTLGDTRALSLKGDTADLLMTSPPYGDNTSTVPYGQHAYLPLQWIDMEDIDPSADRSFLVSTYEIDRRSLGGSKLIDQPTSDRLRRDSPTLDRLISALDTEKRDRRVRVLAFMRDFDDALKVVGAAVRPGGIAAWTVGSRRVGRQLVPLERLLIELAANHGFRHVKTLHRTIPGHRKRMAARNRDGATMMREDVVVLRRTGT
jgi:hypothetical protein